MRSRAELNRLLAMMDVAVEHIAEHQLQRPIAGPVAAPGCMTVAYVAEGVIGVAVAGRTARRCGPRMMALIPGAMSLSCETASGDSLPRLVIGQARVRLSGSDLLDRVRVPIFADLAQRPLVDHCMTELVRLGAGDRDALGTAALADSLMKTCILALLQDFFGRPGIDLKIVSALADPRLATVIAAVLERPHEPHSLANMAATAGLGRSTFSRLFGEAMGQTAIEFVTKTRLYYAAELLRTGKAPVKAVASQVGFASRSHFSRAFSEAYGLDPTAYRQQHAEPVPAPVPQSLKDIPVPRA